MKRLLLITLISAIGSSVVAQSTDNPPFPGGPVLAKAPNFSKWTTTTSAPKTTTGGTDASSSSGKADVPKVIVTTTKTLPILLISTDALGGEKSSRWCVGHFEVILDPHLPGPFITDSSSQNFTDFSHSDFPELQWISEANFAGIKQVGGQKVLLFRKTIALSAAVQSALKAAGHVATGTLCEATIDAETRLPVSFKNGGEVSTYHFEPPPTSILDLPPEVKSIIVQEQNRIQRLSRVPPAG
jgi:hypothetical protein